MTPALHVSTQAIIDRRVRWAQRATGASLVIAICLGLFGFQWFATEPTWGAVSVLILAALLIIVTCALKSDGRLLDSTASRPLVGQECVAMRSLSAQHKPVTALLDAIRAEGRLVQHYDLWLARRWDLNQRLRTQAEARAREEALAYQHINRIAP